MISASQQRNVIPAVCEITVDCRLLPGQHPNHVEPMIRAVLGGDIDYELESGSRRRAERGRRSTRRSGGRSSRSSRRGEPGAKAAPIATAGFTDSHWLREAFGTVAYGFFPARELPAETAAAIIHSADERVPVADLELGVDWLRYARPRADPVA